MNWTEVLRGLDSNLERIEEFLTEERKQYTILPPHEMIFAAFEATPLNTVKVVILGQDPYPTPGHPHGMAFSILPGSSIARGAQNIIAELVSDVDVPQPNNFYLMSWAKQGVLLLNTALTVRAHESGSHIEQWDVFTSRVIRAVSHHREHVVFVLWGSKAWDKVTLIDWGKHYIIQDMHPSPYTAHKGFFGSKPFSRINKQLKAWGYDEIDWTIPNV